MADLETKAAEMFAAGASVNAVSQKLCNRNHPKAKKLHAAWLAENGGAVEEESEAEVEAEADEPQIFDITVEVESEKLAALLGSFTVSEQALAVQSVLQHRMNTLLEA